MNGTYPASFYAVEHVEGYRFVQLTEKRDYELVYRQLPATLALDWDIFRLAQKCGPIYVNRRLVD